MSDDVIIHTKILFFCLKFFSVYILRSFIINPTVPTLQLFHLSGAVADTASASTDKILFVFDSGESASFVTTSFFIAIGNCRSIAFCF